MKKENVMWMLYGFWRRLLEVAKNPLFYVLLALFFPPFHDNYWQLWIAFGMTIVIIPIARYAWSADEDETWENP